MMDKNEAVQKLAKVGRLSIAHAEDLYDSFFEKPVVSQCVADWYEEIKENFGYDLVEAINSIPVPVDGVELSDFKKWILDNENALTTLVNMHQFGYEVEKEERYTVKLKNKSGVEDYLVDTGANGFRFYNNIFIWNREHTRKELEEAGFGWVFGCEGIEIEEVE
nr:MAG: Protein of unknown function (DUF1642) [Bacteriophage sp.]